MDPLTALGAVASIVQLAQTALSLSKILYSFGEAIASASDDIKLLADDLKTFSQSLTLLSRLLEDSKSWYSDDIYLLTAKIIKDCAELYVKIDKILIKLGSNGKSNWKLRVKFVYKEGKIKKLLQRLRDMKGTLATILMSLQVDLQLSLLNISSSSKIQREPEKALQPETIQTLEAARYAVNAGGFLPRYAIQDNNATQLQQFSNPHNRVANEVSLFTNAVNMNHNFVAMALPVRQSPAPVPAHDQPKMQNPFKGYQSVPVSQSNESMPQDIRASTFSASSRSLKSASSNESFKSARSMQDEDLTVARNIKAIQSVMHAFRTALLTLENLIEKRIQNQDSDLYLAARDFRSSLQTNSQNIDNTHISNFKSWGHSYLQLFTDVDSTSLQQKSSEFMANVVMKLHIYSADHEELHTSYFYQLKDTSYDFYEEIVLYLREIALLVNIPENPLSEMYRALPNPIDIDSLPEPPEFSLPFIGYTFRRFGDWPSPPKDPKPEPGPTPKPESIEEASDWGSFEGNRREKKDKQHVEEMKPYETLSELVNTKDDDDTWIFWGSSAKDKENDTNTNEPDLRPLIEEVDDADDDDRMNWDQKKKKKGKIYYPSMGSVEAIVEESDPEPIVEPIEEADDNIWINWARSNKKGKKDKKKVLLEIKSEELEFEPDRTPTPSPAISEMEDAGGDDVKAQRPATSNIKPLSLAARFRPQELRPLFLAESNKQNFAHLNEKYEDLPVLPVPGSPSASNTQVTSESKDAIHMTDDQISTPRHSTHIDCFSPIHESLAPIPERQPQSFTSPVDHDSSPATGNKTWDAFPENCQIWLQAFHRLSYGSIQRIEIFLILNSNLYDFRGNHSKISEAALPEKISAHLKRLASLHNSLKFPEFAEVRNSFESIISIIMTIDEQMGLDVAALGWGCITRFLEVFLFLPQPKNTPIFVKLCRDVLGITAVIARYAVMENLYSQAGSPLSLKTEYRESLVSLCCSILEFFATVFRIGEELNEGDVERESETSQEDLETLDKRCDELMHEIREKDQECKGFRIVVESRDESGSDSDSDIEDVSDENSREISGVEGERLAAIARE